MRARRTRAMPRPQLDRDLSRTVTYAARTNNDRATRAANPISTVIALVSLAGIREFQASGRPAAHLGHASRLDPPPHDQHPPAKVHHHSDSIGGEIEQRELAVRQKVLDSLDKQTVPQQAEKSPPWRHPGM